jgi:hypothetical protein
MASLSASGTHVWCPHGSPTLIREAKARSPTPHHNLGPGTQTKRSWCSSRAQASPTKCGKNIVVACWVNNCRLGAPRISPLFGTWCCAKLAATYDFDWSCSARSVNVCWLQLRGPAVTELVTSGARRRQIKRDLLGKPSR